jgi:elongation factor P
MIESGDLRKGSKILIDAAPYAVLDAQHVKPGKGSAFARCKLKNLETGQLLERTFKSNESFDEPSLEFVEMQYLYTENDMFIFMNTVNYEQITLSAKLMGDQKMFLKENINVGILFYNERPINVELPTFVELPIVYCEPGFKGDTATGASKPATMEGGLIVKVPLHMKEGDILKIDTRTGDYVEKVNK